MSEMNGPPYKNENIRKETDRYLTRLCDISTVEHGLYFQTKLTDEHARDRHLRYFTAKY